MSMPREYESVMSMKEKFYNDHNIDDLVIIENNRPGPDQPPDQSRGQEPRDYSRHPHGAAWRGASPFPAGMKIPRDQWDQRIEEKERKKLNLSDRMRAAGLPCKDQNGTNYCWINAPVHCSEIRLVQANQLDPITGKPLSLSPASNGCKIKNFRNQGGWGQEGLEHMIERGTVPTRLWPDNAQRKEFDTEEAWKEAAKYIVLEWWDLKPRSFDECASCWLQDTPTADGHNWWSHEVTGYDLVKIANSIINKSLRDFRDMLKRKGMVLPREELAAREELMASKYGCRKRNSWGMGYGDDGFFILGESKANPDDCCCPRVLPPS